MSCPRSGCWSSAPCVCGRAHGYQVRNDLEYWGAHEWSNAKPGSIYHALKQMAKQGLLLAHETAPSTAGGPPRTEYEVTDEGLAEYRALLRDAIRAYDQNTDVLSAAVGFIVDLPREEAVGLLKERVEAIKGWRESVTEYYTPEDGPESLGHIGEIMNLWVHSADSGAEWTRGLIARIEGGAYTFAGRATRSSGCSPTARRTRTPPVSPTREITTNQV